MKVKVLYDDDTRATNGIEAYMHCRRCLNERPSGVSPKDYARTQVGIMADGRMQVWCNRHEVNVAVISFETEEGR